MIELQRGGDLSPELHDLHERMLRAVVSGHGPALRGTDLDPVAMASKRSKLIGRASDLVPENAPTVDAGAAPATIAEQLKAAMSQNALFKGAMMLRYRILLEKGLGTLERTLNLETKAGAKSAWLDHARKAKASVEKQLAEEKTELAKLPYSEDELKKALDLLAKKPAKA